MGMYRVCLFLLLDLIRENAQAIYIHNSRIFNHLSFLSHYGDSNPGPTHYEDKGVNENERVMDDGNGKLP